LCRDTDDPAVLVAALNNTNGLANVIAEIGKSGADFYTLSYVCSRQRQDGRDISKHFGRGRRTEVQPELSARLFCHRRGPAGSGGERSCRSCGARRKPVNPLAPFMALGMPESVQIGYRVAIKPAGEAVAGVKTTKYEAEFTVTVDDLNLKADVDGTRTGSLVVGLTVYDRY
jgi:hypothetical protein